MSKLLFDEYPLVVLPSLAVKIGLNEAIILQQMHYWIKKSCHVIESRTWVYNTIEEWAKQFPFFSQSTVRRTIEKLEESGILITGVFNKIKIDKTKWYTINYDALNNAINLPASADTVTPTQQEAPKPTVVVNAVIKSVENSEISPFGKSAVPCAQFEQMHLFKLSKSSIQRLPEMTTTTTTTIAKTIGDSDSVDLKQKNYDELSFYVKGQWGRQGNIGYDKLTEMIDLGREFGRDNLYSAIKITGDTSEQSRNIRYLKGVLKKIATGTPAPLPKSEKPKGMGYIEHDCNTCSTHTTMRVVDLVKHKGESFTCSGCGTKHSVDNVLKDPP